MLKLHFIANMTKEDYEPYRDKVQVGDHSDDLIIIKGAKHKHVMPFTIVFDANIKFTQI